MLSYKKLITLNKQFADNHYVIKNFGNGERWQIVDHDQTPSFKYPLMFVEDLPFSGQTKEFTYTLRCWFVTRVEAPTDRGSDLLYSEYATAKSSMVQCALDLVSYWVQDTNYSSLEIDKNFNIETFIDKTKDRDTGCYIDLRFRDVFNYDSCIIPMDGVAPPPSSECSPVSVTLNGVTPLTNAESGSNRNLEFFDEEDNVVTPTIDSDSATNTVFIFNDVPMTFNGTATAGALVGGSKSITVQDSNGVQIGSVINDEQLNLTIQVPAITSITSNVINTGQETSYRTGDDGDRFLNGDYASVNMADLSDFYTLSTANEWGHFKRYTGDTGGYMDEATGNFFDVNGVATTKLGAFPNEILRDYATRRRWYLRRSGARTWNDCITLTLTESRGGETGWFCPNRSEYESLSSANSKSPSYIDNRLFNWSVQNMWCSTTEKNITTNALRYNGSVDTWTSEVKTQTNANAYVKLF
jgi:hypothetical protein